MTELFPLAGFFFLFAESRSLSMMRGERAIVGFSWGVGGVGGGESNRLHLWLGM